METNRLFLRNFRIFLSMALWLSSVLYRAAAGAAQLPSQPSSLQTRPGAGPFKNVPAGTFKAKVKSPSSLNPNKGQTFAGAKKPGVTKIQNISKMGSDSMNEYGETESQRLQMAMDRKSKFETTLSNVEKKTEKTSDNIVQNLKN